MASVTRGIRNNNPMNIRKGSKWLGLSSDTNKDPDFCVFNDIRFGLRAAMYLLTRYVFDYHCDTIHDIIFRWAPPSENSTDRYVSEVTSLWNLLTLDGCYNSREPKICTRNDLFCLMVCMCEIESRYFLFKDVFDVSFNLLPKNFRELWTKQS